MIEKTFELRNIGLVQAGESIFGTFGVFAIGLCGSFFYSIFYSHGGESIFFHLRNAFLFFLLIYGCIKLFGKKKNMKTSAALFLLKISNCEFIIEIDRAEVYNGKLNDIRAVRTLELNNKKNDVQGQIFVGDNIFNLASSLDNHNKNEFNDFVRFCEKRLKMLIKPVPFSIYTHNFQGIKYIEYYNPQNPL